MLSVKRCWPLWSSDLSGQGDGGDGGSCVGWHLEESSDRDLGALEPDACGHVVECASGVVIGVDSGVVQVRECRGEGARWLGKNGPGGDQAVAGFLVAGHAVDLGPSLDFQGGVRMGDYAGCVALHQRMKRGVVSGADGSVCGSTRRLGISCRGIEGFDGCIDETPPIQRYRRLCGWR